MIQAPNSQYIPVQQQIPAGYQQQGANNNAVQYNQMQNPGVIYNYPTSSCYMPQQSYPCYSSGTPQYNGVNIEILNPQGQGLTPQNIAQMPAQFIPVQQPIQMPMYPQYPTSQAIVQAPQQMEQPAPVMAPQQQIPAPQIQQQNAPQTVMPQQQEVPQAAAPVIDQAVVPDSSQTPEAFAGKLRTDDLAAQEKAIKEIAEAVKDNDTLAPVLIDTQIFDALLEIINKDTSSLEGPSPEIIELRKKPKEELTEEERTKASTLTPRDSAEINKQYAIYTISYMQERLNNELEKNNREALPLKDLPCIEDVVDTVKQNPNPMLREGAIAALSHIARPEYKDELNTIFDLAKSDEDPRVQDAATKASNLLNGNVQEEQKEAA